MLFRYRGIDQRSGQSRKGVIEASSIDEAKAKLRAEGILYTSVTARGATWRDRIGLRVHSGTFAAQELATLSRDLAIYLQAGIPIANALRLAKSQYSTHKRIGEFLASVIALVDEGKSLYQALELQQTVRLPEFYKHSIKVAEKSGALEEVLRELAHFLKEQDRIARQIKGALAYPLFLMIVSLFMIFFMLSYVVPKVTAIFEQMGQKLPPITRFVVEVGLFFQRYWLELALFMVAAVALWYVLSRKFFLLRYWFDYVLLRMPLLGKIVRTSELARFAYMASVLLRSGLPFVQAVTLSAKIVKNSVLRSIFEDAAQKVVEGSKFSVALSKRAQLIDRSFVQAIALGEETSSLPTVLQNIGELYREENRDKTSLLLSLLEPALMLFVGGVIGFIVTAMLLPIFSLQIGSGF